MRWLGWNLIQYNWYTYKKEKFGHKEELSISQSIPQPSAGDSNSPFQKSKQSWIPDKSRKISPKANI